MSNPPARRQLAVLVYRVYLNKLIISVRRPSLARLQYQMYLPHVVIEYSNKTVNINLHQ